MTLFSSRLRLFVLTSFAATLLLSSTSCDWTSAEPGRADSVRVTVEDVRVQPQPLVPDTTAVFEAVTGGDQESLLYKWYLAGVAPVIVGTSDTVSWETPPRSALGDRDSVTYSHVVVVDDTLDDVEATAREFTVTVTNPLRGTR